MEKQHKIVSIKDIAEISGVSVATVSRVLNNKGKCSEATKDRVLAIAKQYGYISNMAAKSLRESRSNTIGLIIPNVTNTFFSNIAYAIETFLFEKNYSLFICNSGNNAEKERAYFRSLVSKNVDGILCISELNELPSEVMTRDIPIVSVDRHPSTPKKIPWVGNDDVEMSKCATQHLINNGCKKILFISSYHSEYSHQLRLQGYEITLRKNGLGIDKNLILERIGEKSTLEEVEELVNNSIANGLAFDGILASSEMAGIGAITALKKQNLQIPNDIKIICFDNSYLSEVSSPKMSSIERNPGYIATESCKLLLQLIHGESINKTDLFIPTKLIQRDTTK